MQVARFRGHETLMKLEHPTGERIYAGYQNILRAALPDD